MRIPGAQRASLIDKQDLTLVTTLSGGSCEESLITTLAVEGGMISYEIVVTKETRSYLKAC